MWKARLRLTKLHQIVKTLEKERDAVPRDHVHELGIKGDLTWAIVYVKMAIKAIEEVE